MQNQTLLPEGIMNLLKDLACIAAAATLAAGFLKAPELKAFAQSNQQPITNNQQPTTPTKTQRRLKIELSISNPSDLKVREGDTVAAGQILADRIEERTKLENQRSQINLAIKKIQAETLAAPIAPKATPAMPQLPPISYASEESAITQSQAQLSLVSSQQPYLSQSASLDAAKVREAELKRKLDLQQRKLDAIKNIDNLPPSVAEHEGQIVSQRINELEQATAEVGVKSAELENSKLQHASLLQQLADKITQAQASLQAAQQKRSHDEYQHQITLARRIEEANQANLQYQRQQQEYSNQKRDKEFQLAQLTQKLGEVEDRLKLVAVVKSPYNGVIKNLKQTKQSDNTLLVELSLIRSESAVTRAATPAGTTRTGATTNKGNPTTSSGTNTINRTGRN